MTETGAQQDPILTRTAYERLQAELERLKTEGREHMSERLLHARELGDISENAEFDAAKNEQGLMEGRIRQLEALLKHAVVQDGPIESDRVVPGMLVTVRDGDGDESTYLYAHNLQEKTAGARTITNASPLGAALAGKAVGEAAIYQAPAGTFTVEVVGIASWDGL